ncbi:3'-5' exonuclease isoform X2 [Salvia miltiorrhiza]|uniref:3'-5' exonuclease isoform X2 n=1 Tax=Salvia miltiorrhiza TaxID=226208 RepID=UPI0025AC1866|nr:3'-5' exonuclease isoform X2 [Salvia miltiorrhiza]
MQNAQKMAIHRSLLFRYDFKGPAQLRKFSRMGEMPNSDSDWYHPLTDEDLRAIDSVISSALPPKRHRHDNASAHSPPKLRRRLPSSLFVFQQQQQQQRGFNISTVPFSSCSSRYHGTNRSPVSPFQEIKFGGHIIYSRTMKEVERSAQELLDFVEAKKRNGGQCFLGLDIEWRPSFKRGVAPGKAAVMQICGDNSCCHVLHLFHSGIPKNLQSLLEDDTSFKVGMGIAMDAKKVLKDYDVSISTLRDLSDIANQKLGGDRKKWSLLSLTEMLICKQLPKPNIIRLGNWEANVLSDEQLKYAAVDAYVSWYLYQVLNDYPDPVVNEATEMDAT